MATEDLKIDVTVNGQQAKVTLNEIDSKIEKIGSTTNKTGSIMNKNWVAIGASVAVATIAIGEVINKTKEFVDTAAKFEQFEVALKTIEGSSAKAKKAMEWITEFGVKTPYEIDQITEAFVRLRSYGIDPTDGTLKTLGDTSSAMSKPLMQSVEAMADAMTGQNERLKEFGITSNSTGKTIHYNWIDSSGKMRDITIENNKKIIQSTLTAIWNEKYAGAMEQQSKTWNGILSNISDSWTKFQVDVMEGGGLFNYLKALALTIGDVFSSGFETGKDHAKGFSDFIISAIELVIRAIGLIGVPLNALAIPINFVKAAFWTLVGDIGTGVNTIQKIWNDLGNIIAVVGANVANGFKEVFAEAVNAVIAKVNSLAAKVNAAASKVGIGEIFSPIENVSFTKTVAKISQLSKPIFDVASAYKKASSAANDLMDNAKGVAYLESMKQAEATIQQIHAKLKEINAEDKKNNEEKEKARKELEELIAKYNKQAEAAGKAGKAGKDAVKELERQEEERQKKIEEFYDEYRKATTDQYHYELSKLDQQRAEYEKYITDKVALNAWYNAEKLKIEEQYSERYKQLQELQERAINDLSQSITDMIMTGKSGFKDMLRTWVSDIIQSQVSSILKSITSSLFSSGSGGTIVGGILSLFGLHTGTTKVLHTGGHIASYHSGMRTDERIAKLQVGEAVINRAGASVNQKAIDAMNRGKKVGEGAINQTMAEINFNVQAIDSNSFNSYLINNRQTIESIINKSLTSNGSVRRTIKQSV